MEKLTLNKRLRVYASYGIVSLLIIYLVLTITDELIMIFIPLAINLLLVEKFKKYRIKSVKWIGLVAAVITTGIFLTQYQYRHYVGGHFMGIRDSTANLSYSSTLILFTLIIWEFSLVQVCKMQTKE